MLFDKFFWLNNYKSCFSKQYNLLYIIYSLVQVLLYHQWFLDQLIELGNLKS